MSLPQASEQGATSYNPSRDDFAALLEESFEKNDIDEGAVVKGKIVAIENDVAVIDVGLKTEGRVALKEFGVPGRPGSVGIGPVLDRKSVV